MSGLLLFNIYVFIMSKVNKNPCPVPSGTVGEYYRKAGVESIGVHNEAILSCYGGIDIASILC